MNTSVKHYIVGWGSHGCLFDGCHVARTVPDAVEIAAQHFELGRTRRAQLTRDWYLELKENPVTHESPGAEYIELTECDCGTPWVHDDSMTESEWSNG